MFRSWFLSDSIFHFSGVSVWTIRINRTCLNSILFRFTWQNIHELTEWKLFKWFIDYFYVQFSNNPRFGSSNLNFTLRMIYFFLRRASLFYLWANSLIGLHVISAEHYTVRLTKYTQIVTVVLSKMMRFFKLYRISINDHQKLCTTKILHKRLWVLFSCIQTKRLLYWYEFLLWTFLHAFHD